jgi:ech hydrogenase subunit D
MRHLPASRTLSAEALVDQALDLHDGGWRFVTASCIPRPDGRHTVLYHFERGGELRHLRVEVPPGSSVPSIGPAFAGAFLVENEMRDLQGLPVAGLAIDYGGRLFRDLLEPPSGKADP